MTDLMQQQHPDVAALRRLFNIANDHSGQCRYVARFLLGLYNGQRFPFDLTDMRCVDSAIFDDMMIVLRMNKQPSREVHTYFDNGGDRFEALAHLWRIPDRERLHLILKHANLENDAQLRKERDDYVRADIY